MAPTGGGGHAAGQAAAGTGTEPGLSTAAGRGGGTRRRAAPGSRARVTAAAGSFPPPAPVCGQGANNACHCASIYFQSILEHGREPFSPEWMQRTFDAYWGYARYPTAFSNLMLGQLPEHVQRVLGAASQNQVVARRFAECYANPPDLENWLLDEAKTDAFLASVAAEPAS